MPGVFIEEDDICLYVTESCNSNCLMCPMSTDTRKRGLFMTEEDWDKALDQIPSDAKHVTITGGEPFLAYRHVIPFLGRLNEKCPETNILILTNGRALCISEIAGQLKDVITGKYCIAIPVHAPSAELHDYITSSPGSFSQTMEGLRFLSRTKAKTEIRIVGSSLNKDVLSDIFVMLVGSGLRISVINLIAMEMTGSAAARRNELWIEYRQVYDLAKQGILYAVAHGIDVGLYNFPLCQLPEIAWPLAKNSITPSKVRYNSSCENCLEKDTCGGLFYSVQELNICNTTPILRSVK